MFLLNILDSKKWTKEFSLLFLLVLLALKAASGVFGYLL